MTSERIGVGIIGANVEYGWGTRAHLPALQALPDQFEMVAVATTRQETASATAERFGIPAAYDSAEGLIADPRVQLVVVCVRVPSHHELTAAALQAGKHVFCEWPLGANTEEARQLRDLAHAKGVRHMVGLQAQAAPAFMRMRELIASGHIGEVLSATLHQALPGAANRRQSFAWAADAEKGATTLSIAAGHALDALTFCLGEFCSLDAIVSTQVTEVTVVETGERLEVTAPDTVLVHGEVEGGVLASVSIKSVPAVGTGFRLEVHGTHGALAVSSLGMSQIADLMLEGAGRGERQLVPLEIPDECWVVPRDLTGPPLNVAQLFARLSYAIETGRPVEPDFDHAVRRHELLDAIQMASDTGLRQTVE